MGDSEVQARIEAELARRMPEVEVVMAEVVGGRGGSGGGTVRLYVDHPDGVDHALCARVTEELRDWLDQYGVEVSSPGLDRPLRKPEHFARFVGRRVTVRTIEPIEGRRTFTGILVGADGQGVAVEASAGTASISHDNIRRSNLIAEAGT